MVAHNSMMKRALPLLAGLLVAGSLGAASPRPNIVVILADDLGYETIGANGGQSYATPRLDTLATTGIRFRQAYVQPLCTPTRVQLMTGKYNVRNYDVFGILHAGQVTFANLLREAGYKTFVGGKWQLEGGYDGPIGFGFDEYFLWQLNRRPQRYYTPGFEAFIPADGLLKVETNYPAGNYGPDVVCGKILDFIERHQAQPFLVYYPMMLTHSPFTPAPDHPAYDPAATSELDNTAYFGSMVEHMDKIVGRIVDKLEVLGLRTNTLLLFIGDNGTGTPVTSIFNGQPFQGGKGKTTTAGTHVPLIVNWPGAIPTSQVSDALVDSTDVLPTICEAAGVAVPPGLDGRSFLPQLLGQPGTPRAWSYCWYKAQNATEAQVKECAHTGRFKLYATGLFYDMSADVLEQSPLDTGALGAEAQAAFNLLTGALASFSTARQDRALPPQPNPALWSSPPAASGIGSIAMTAAGGSDVNGPVEYQFRNVTLSRDSAWQSAPSYADSGLADATTYTYQVRMQDLLGNATGWSEARSAATPASPNPQFVIIEQPSTDGNAAAQNLGQSFTVTAAHDGWFLDTITFYAVTNTGGDGLGLAEPLRRLYQPHQPRTRAVGVHGGRAQSPHRGQPDHLELHQRAAQVGRDLLRRGQRRLGRGAAASEGIPAQRMLVNAYAGGMRLNETGPSTDIDLRFTVTARRFPASYGQWALTVPPGLPSGFGDAISAGAMPNGWKYFLGLAPLEDDPGRWPRIAGGAYVFALDPKVGDVFWRIRHSATLQTPLTSWATFDPQSPQVSYDPVTGQVQLPLPGSGAGFLRLEIGLR